MSAERGVRSDTTRTDRLKALNVPRRVTVELGDTGFPMRLREGGRGKGEEWKTVEAIGDSWRLDDEWWRRPVSRRYVEVLLAGGGRMVLYEDLVTEEWYVQTR